MKREKGVPSGPPRPLGAGDIYVPGVGVVRIKEWVAQPLYSGVIIPELVGEGDKFELFTDVGDRRISNLEKPNEFPGEHVIIYRFRTGIRPAFSEINIRHIERVIWLGRLEIEINGKRAFDCALSFLPFCLFPGTSENLHSEAGKKMKMSRGPGGSIPPFEAYPPSEMKISLADEALAIMPLPISVHGSEYGGLNPEIDKTDRVTGRVVYDWGFLNSEVKVPLYLVLDCFIEQPLPEVEEERGEK
jgi:hypothetical protein